MSQNQDIEKLFDDAAGAGVLSADSQAMLTGHLGPVVVAGASGLAMEDIVVSDVTLITLLIDASSSISQSRLEAAVRAGQNAMLDAFLGAKEQDSLLVGLWLFNDTEQVVHSYVPVKDAVRLDTKSYRASGSTVLYDVWCDALASNVAYAQRLRDSGTPAKSVVVVITDGEDTSSRRRASDCARLSRDLLASEQFVLAFVGVGKRADFTRVATEMGVPQGSILHEPDASPSNLRKAFQLVSRSAIRASQGLVGPGARAGFFQP
jgi:hypothetical protein